MGGSGRRFRWRRLRRGATNAPQRERRRICRPGELQGRRLRWTESRPAADGRGARWWPRRHRGAKGLGALAGGRWRWWLRWLRRRSRPPKEASAVEAKGTRKGALARQGRRRMGPKVRRTGRGTADPEKRQAEPERRRQQAATSSTAPCEETSQQRGRRRLNQDCSPWLKRPARGRPWSRGSRFAQGRSRTATRRSDRDPEADQCALARPPPCLRRPTMCTRARLREGVTGRQQPAHRAAGLGPGGGPRRAVKY
jgi:hypothetical protein